MATAEEKTMSDLDLEKAMERLDLSFVHHEATEKQNPMSDLNGEKAGETLDPPENAFSDLSRHSDPFAPREGKTLLWKNVNMILNGGGKESERKLLDNVWGEVPQKDTTAIMGPSGAGKTSLLNILAGRSRSNAHLKITADVRLDNYSVDPTNITFRQKIAFVAQEDSLQQTATPREAIRFSAKLRLPKVTTDAHLDQLTERMIAELGLSMCAETIVGGALIKGVSGGERKRTSVGVELVTRPAIVFLDEPTSGLDSFSAVQLCQVLKKVANAGSTVLFTIHQPSSDIFNSFDRLILLNQGCVMYQGPVSNVPSYFADHGKPVPPNYNPADWIMFVAQSFPKSELEKSNFFPKDERDIGDAFAPGEGTDAIGNSVTRESVVQNPYAKKTPGIGTQVKLLFTREITNLFRDTKTLAARFFLTTFISTLSGCIFFQVGNEPRNVPVNVQSQFGACLIVLMMGMFGTAMPTMIAFPQERPVFLREYSTNHYSVFAYYASRLTMEALLTGLQILVLITIGYNLISFNGRFIMFFATIYSLAMGSTALAVMLGSAMEDPKMAIEMLPLLFVPQMLFAGFFVPPTLMPVWLRWARYICPLTFALRILLVEEFQDCADAELAAGSPGTCSTMLANDGANSEDTWWYWLVLITLFVVFRTLALTILARKALKFY